MRKSRYILVALLAGVLAFTACKSNEANYRRAYERAIATRSNEGTIDSLVAGTFYTESGRPRVYNLGNGDTLYTRVEYVTLTKDAGNPEGATLSRYNVVAGQFRQIFNAKSLKRRLEQLGYPALVVHNQTPHYYVVASSSSMAIDALEDLRHVAADDSLRLLSPCPFVLEPAQLSR